MNKNYKKTFNILIIAMAFFSLCGFLFPFVKNFIKNSKKIEPVNTQIYFDKSKNNSQNDNVLKNNEEKVHFDYSVASSTDASTTIGISSTSLEKNIIEKSTSTILKKNLLLRQYVFLAPSDSDHNYSLPDLTSDASLNYTNFTNLISLCSPTVGCSSSLSDSRLQGNDINSTIHFHDPVDIHKTAWYAYPFIFGEIPNWEVGGIKISLDANTFLGNSQTTENIINIKEPNGVSNKYYLYGVRVRGNPIPFFGTDAYVRFP